MSFLRKAAGVGLLFAIGACSAAEAETQPAEQDFHSATHVLYIDFDGASLSAAPSYAPERGEASTDDATRLLSSKVHGEVLPTKDTELDAAARARVVDRVRGYYADFDITITTTAPPSGREHTLVVVGSRGASFQFADASAGIAFGIGGYDCKNADAHEGIGVVLLDQTIPYFSGAPFAQFAGRTPTRDDVERAVAVEIAHEAGHTFGLGHVDTANSLMHYWVNNIVAVGNEDWRAGPWIEKKEILAACNGSADTSIGSGNFVQDPRKVLLQVLGPHRP